MENQIDDRAANQNELTVEQILDDKRGIDTIEDVVTNTTVFPEPLDIQIPNAHDENEPLGRGCRVKYPSTRLQGYVIHMIQ